MDISKLQPDSWSHIQSIVSKNRLGNAYLIHGPSGAGKEAFALKFCSEYTLRDVMIRTVTSVTCIGVIDNRIIRNVL